MYQSVYFKLERLRLTISVYSGTLSIASLGKSAFSRSFFALAAAHHEVRMPPNNCVTRKSLHNVARKFYFFQRS